MGTATDTLMTMMNLPTGEFPPGVFDNPLLFAPAFLRIITKEYELQPLDYRNRRVQMDWLRNRSHRDLILKFRQPGMSTCIQGELFRKAVTSTVSTATLSHQNSTTQRFRRMVDRFYNNLPQSFRPQRLYNNAGFSTYPDFDSESIIFTAGSADVGVGFSFSHAHCSEVSRWKDPESIVAGLLQGVPRHGYVVMESTANGAQGWFYERCMEALDGKGDWKLHFYPWFFDPHDKDYQIPLEPDETLVYEPDEQALVEKHNLIPEQIKFRRAKQAELLWLFPQEYPEDPYSCFLTSGEAFFGVLDEDVWQPVPDDLPPPGHRIVAGLDFGQKNDYTVLSIVDVKARRQLFLGRWNRLSWEEMRRRIRHECYLHGVQMMVVEINSIGGPNFEELRKEFDAHTPGYEIGLIPFETTNASKQLLMGDLYVAVHEDDWKLIDTPEHRQEYRVFQSTQLASGKWRYEAPSGAHDDTVMADAFAIHAARRLRVPEFA